LWKERNSIGNYLVKKQKPTNRNSPILQPATLLFPRALILRGSIAVYLGILCFNKASPLLKKAKWLFDTIETLNEMGKVALQ